MEDDGKAMAGAVARKQRILDFLKEKGGAKVSDLHEMLGVSAVTIRSDLASLEKLGLVVRTHGGAVLAERRELVRLVSRSLNEYPEEKKKIAHMASLLVETNNSIFIDSGSTTVRIADYLGGNKLFVVTNSLLVMDKLAGNDGIQLFFIGGTLRRASMGMVGEEAIEMIRRIHCDVLFLGATTVDVEKGIFSSSLHEAAVKRAMIEAADKVVLCADSSKWGKTSVAKISGWDRIDVYVTDAIAPGDKEELKSRGIEVFSE